MGQALVRAKMRVRIKLVSTWLMVMHTYLYYFPLSLSFFRIYHVYSTATFDQSMFTMMSDSDVTNC